MARAINSSRGSKRYDKGKATQHDAKNAMLAGGYPTGLPGKLISDVVLGTNAWLHGAPGRRPY